MVLWKNKGLIASLAQHDIQSQYKGSVLGVLWTIFQPVLMLLVYTFVFSVVFKARWGHAVPESQASFALILFLGVIIYTLVAESLLRAPQLITSNATFVKKVVFPLEILPVVSFAALLVRAGISLAIWSVAYPFVFGMPPITCLLFPVLIIPISLYVLGMSWFLASMGVFIKDVNQLVGLFTMVLMFLTPIFYPLEAIPERLRAYLTINPLAFLLEQARGLLIYGTPLMLTQYLLVVCSSIIVAWVGYAWFVKTRKGFADIV